jgi:hypothetical protein
VPRVCSVIERHRQIRLLGEGAEPFTVLIDEATKLPSRQFELDQSKRRVTPSAGLDQLIDPSSLSSPVQHWKAYASVCDDSADEIGGERRRKPKLLGQPIEAVLVFWIEQHDTISQEQRS